MFFHTKRIERLERELVLLEDLFADAIKRIETLEKAAHGLKKDGQPRQKPGRKREELI